MVGPETGLGKLLDIREVHICWGYLKVPIPILKSDQSLQWCSTYLPGI